MKQPDLATRSHLDQDAVAEDEPVGIGVLTPERRRQLGEQLGEYVDNAIIASLRLGGPESIDEILDLENFFEALEYDPNITQTRGFVFGVAEALGVGWPDVLELVPDRELDWRKFDPQFLNTINADRAKRGVGPLDVAAVTAASQPAAPTKLTS